MPAGRPKGDPNHPRRGTGKPAGGFGWGGPARGDAPPVSKGGRPVGVKNGEGRKAQAREALENAAPLAVQTLIDVASDAADQRAVAAAVAILNRVGLHEKHGVEVGGEGGGPVRIKVEIVDATDDALGGAAAVSPADQD